MWPLLPLLALPGSQARCPAEKTVPYICPPGVTRATQCIYGTYHGTYSLSAAESPLCPPDEGYIGLPNTTYGCLYTRTGSQETFCFKPLPEEPFLDPTSMLKSLVSASSRSCINLFPGVDQLDDTEKAGLCCSGQECQLNAGCFLNEASGQYRAQCHCLLGHSLDPSAPAALPATGTCRPMDSTDCGDQATCYQSEGEKQYTVCPYCKVYRGEAVIGSYVQGKGTFQDNEPMEFLGFQGMSLDGCSMTKTSVFWYCWYNMFNEVVDLSKTYLNVEEANECEQFAYIYTPLACSFAAPA